MKKKYYLTIASLLTVAFGSMQAQVVNGNFETIKDNGFVSNWGTNIILPIAVGLEGQPVENNFTFGCWPGFVFPTWDSHHGLTAMQLTNALNLTTNEVIASKSLIFNDAKLDFPGWNAGVPVDSDDSVTMLGFHYKFFPMGNDIAEAELILFGSDGQELGRATADIMGMNSEYNYLYAPVQFTASGIPTSMQISFSMAKAGSTPSFGSTLIVDDVIVNWAALANNGFQSAQFAVFPTVANNEINILKGTSVSGGNYEFTISNIEGKTVSHQSIQLIDNSPVAVDVSQLSKGVYIISSKGYSTKFIKQ